MFFWDITKKIDKDKSTSPKNAVTAGPCYSAAPGPQRGPQGTHSQQLFSWVKHKPIVNDVIDVFDGFSYYLVHLVFYLVNSL